MDVSTPSRKILRALCNNSRITVTALANELGLSRSAVKARIVSLEREFGLKYTLEIDYAKLNLSSLHILRLKFKKKPKPEEIKGAFERSAVVQFAAMTKGDFDAIVIVLAKDTKEYFKWEVGLWDALAPYGLESRPSEVVVSHLGLVPVNNRTLEKCDLNDTYKKIITNLNQDSRMTMRDLSKRIKMGEALTKYYVEKLAKSGIIRRYTTIVTKPPLKHSIVYFANYTVREGVIARVENERRMMYWKPPQEFPIISEFQFMWSMTGSYASFTWACYDDYEQGVKDSVMTHKRIYSVDSPVMESATIDTVLKGDLPLRNMDQKESYDTTLGSAMD